MAKYDYVIVGAGISGAALAYFLKKGGAARVLLLERGDAASGGTGKSAAIVRQHYSTRLMARLARRSVELFRAMPEDLGQDGGYRGVGYIFLSAADNAAAAQKNVAMQREVGIDTTWLDAGTVAQRCPWLNTDGLVGAAFEPHGGYADPVQSVDAYIAAFRRLGGEVRTRTACRKLLREGDRIVGVVTDEGAIEAGMVVNAAGPWAPALARLAGATLAMRSIREQDTVWEARANRPLPIPVLAVAIDGIYIRRLSGTRYVIGRGFPKEYVDCDPYNFKVTADDDFITDVITRAEMRIPAFAGARLIDAYASYYDVTPDWHPYLGPRRDIAGYCDASGGSGHGFKFGPSFGESVATWLRDGDVESDFKTLSYDRILDGQLLGQTFGGNRG